MNYCINCMSAIDDNTMLCPYCGKSQNVEIPPHHLLPGTTLNGKYLIGAAIGEGGFGITYVGRDLVLDIKVAIKEYYPNGYVNRSNTVSASVSMVTTNEEKRGFYENGKQKFLNEARTLAKFSDEPGIVCARDFLEANGTAYIVMDYLEGVTLKKYLKEHGVMSPAETLNFLRPLMNSLNRVHKANLIHRDISPDNIMIVKNQPKLLDFGATRAFSAMADKSLSVVLKPGYAPEEQYRTKGEQGPWTDVYALSATIYKCITGVTPDDATQRMYRDELKKPSELGIAINPSFENALMKGLAITYTNRYQNIDELMNGLDGQDNVKKKSHNVSQQALQPNVNPAAYNTAAGSGGKKKSGGKIIAIAAAAAILIAGIVLAVVLLSGKNSDKSDDKDEQVKTASNLKTDKDESSEKDDIDDKKEEVEKTDVKTVDSTDDQNEETVVNDDPVPTVTDSEPDTGSDNNYIGIGQAITESLADKDDSKVYFFKTTEPGKVWISFRHDYIDDESYFWVMEVYNDKDVFMTSIAREGNITGFKESRGMGLPAGTYYIKVKPYEGKFSALPYTLLLNFDSTEIWEQEFNDKMEDANPIPVDTDIHGSVWAEEDKDWYSLEVEKSGDLVIDFGNLKADKSHNYWNAYIYDDTGKELLSSSFHGNVSGYEHSDKVAVSPGKYYICVTQGERRTVYEYFFKLSLN